jgi:hypothetical protein
LIVPGRTPGYARYQPTRDAIDAESVRVARRLDTIAHDVRRGFPIAPDDREIAANAIAAHAATLIRRHERKMT